MNQSRFNAYEDFILKNGSASLSQLVRYTASNKFVTLLNLNECIKENLIKLKRGRYYLIECNY